MLNALLVFIPACFALNMAFGPNNLLSVRMAGRYGLKTAMIAGTGRLVAFAIMIAVAACGMGALLMASEKAFAVVKILGSAYLIYLGLKIIFSKKETGETHHIDRKAVNTRDLFKREFLVAIGNPKAILIFTAFLPQFVMKDAYWLSFLVMGAIYLALEMVAIILYAFAGMKLSSFMKSARNLRFIDYISGTTMVAFGTLLALTKRPAS